MGIIKIPKDSVLFFKNNLDDIIESGNLAESIWNHNLASLVKEQNSSLYALPTSSNGTGMLAVLIALRELYKTKFCILSANTMYGVLTTINTAGYTISKYVDCDPTILMPSPDDVSKVINSMSYEERSQTVFVLSHIGGIPDPFINEIATLCRVSGIRMVEDCAHSYYTKCADGFSGNFGDAGVFSFYSTKAIPAGEGGAIVTNDVKIYDYVTRFSVYDRFEQQYNLGLNIRMSEIQALFTYSVLKNADDIVKNKKKIAERYNRILDFYGIKYIDPNKLSVLSNYYKYIVLTQDKTLLNMKNKTSPVYDYIISPYCEDLPGIKQIIKGHMCLPIWYGYEEEKINSTIEELKKILIKI